MYDLTDKEYPLVGFYDRATLLRSAQKPRITNNHMACPAHAIAFTEGGGGENKLAIWAISNKAIKIQNTILPVRFFALVALK